MTLSASTLTILAATGSGTIVATNNSTINLTGLGETDTIKLVSGHLNITNANRGFEEQPNPAMNFIAPITGFNAASAITLYDTQATSEVFAKTSPTVGDLMLYNGATEVASLQISGASHVYASIVPGVGGVVGSILLTSTDTGHSLPITG
jgi:hypothetical protein